MKTLSLHLQRVEFIPRELEEGILYLSEQFKTASHLCCCGCGTKIVTPLRLTEYSATIVGEAVSLYPSIGNWNFPCQSHYWIKGGRIIVAAPMTPDEIAWGRQCDDEQKDAYFTKSIPWWRQLLRYFSS